MFSDNVWTALQQVENPADMIKQHVPIDSTELTQSTTIHAKDGSTFATLYGPEQRTYIPFEEIPSSVINAFIAVEDQHFFEHTGIDGSAIVRSLIVNARSQSTDQGGSTITQQLARNLYLTHTKTYKRKLNEAFYSYRLEKKYSKEKIIELYSNAIYFGNGVYGIETASQYYFGKSVQKLTLAEIALLTGIPNNPNQYEPIKHMDAAIVRQQHVLKKMLENKYINKSDYEQARQEKIKLNIQKAQYRYPDYTSYVIHELKALVKSSEPFDKNYKDASTEAEKAELNKQVDQLVMNLIYEKGVKIETHFDQKMQNEALKGIKRIPTSVEGAFVILDHNNHQINAIVGGRDMEANEFNRAYQAYRQPGSTIKPLLAFAPFLNETKTPLSIPISAAPYCKPSYCPKNSGNAKYSNVSIRKAISQSINTAAVRMVDRVGVEKAFHYLSPFDFQRVLPKDRNISAVLGGFTHGVSPVELTNAYSTFSNNGQYKPSRAIKQVLSLDGNELYQWEDQSQPVWSKQTNDSMRTLLNSVMTSGTGRQANVLHTSFIGGKTGTTNDVKDLWFVGITDRYTAGIWVGKDQPAPIPHIQRSALHLKIWKQVMENITP
ncbi:transglycosylase domain-containing protein [Pseudalkalibacillus berkeleyi]|uniref:Penicillin-binding protein n=1 Tax=Pseudalkalibacillus berkeleyi TaxID=1069813 RepID=A0ABS9GWZ2_9BACL|nr:transglycosylase domain-containing protein [Pseudalkalibacillus berkeleyi]MCF6136115.1 penicillin-binding protein [Pseudalkalibacillus berkeleyi]